MSSFNYSPNINTRSTGCFYCLVLLAFILAGQPVSAQNTLGLISKRTGKSFPGYNLIYPHNQPHVYLLDSCGQLVHTWEDEVEYRPGNTAYILENGNLVKTKRLNSSPVTDPIWAGGGGAIVEIRDWDNQLLSSFELNNALFRLHHDIAPLPNGNILMIAWAKKSYEEAVAAGRDPDLLPQNELWSEAVLEWDPVLDSIVWEWHVWDHLIQDHDPTQANYGKVSEHPGLIDINYDEHDGHPDWLHINSIDYNPVLDQFVLSVPYFNEFWIVDHSTTVEEAKGSSGGRSGKGGDLLFRWGNPLAYGRGDAANKKLFFQHDVHWAEPSAQEGTPYYGRIAVFNNQVGEGLSTADVLNTGYDQDTDTYPFDGTVFGDSDFERTVVHPTGDIRSVSDGLSSVQILPNGNWLICSGRWGYTYELDPEGKIVWEYVTPIKAGQPATQGDTLRVVQNMTFRLTRYFMDFPGFAGRDLSPAGYLELNPNPNFCSMVTSTSATFQPGINIFPNPVSGQLTIEGLSSGRHEFRVYNQMGNLVETTFGMGPQQVLDTADWPSGLYFLRIDGGPARKLVVLR